MRSRGIFTHRRRFMVAVAGGYAAAQMLAASADFAARADAPRPPVSSAPGASGPGGSGLDSSTLEARLEPFFLRKDLFTLGREAAEAEIVRLLGALASGARVQWLSPQTARLRLLTVDRAPIPSGSTSDHAPPGGTGISGEGDDRQARRESVTPDSAGFVSYAIVEEAAAGGRAAPRVSWYHDAGSKRSEQANAAWHPVGAEMLTPKAGGARGTLVVTEADGPDGSPRGLLVFDSKGDGWVAARRVAPAGMFRGVRLIAAGPEGAVFLADREPLPGVLTGAPRSLFRSIILYERSSGEFSEEPVVSALPDVVSAAEAVIGAIRKDDREAAARACTSGDVLGQMLYFSPAWKGSGRVLSAERSKLEILYEETGRPTLRITFEFRTVAGALLLSDVRGKAETVPHQ